jgi:hypothetical protein
MNKNIQINLVPTLDLLSRLQAAMFYDCHHKTK